MAAGRVVLALAGGFDPSFPLVTQHLCRPSHISTPYPTAEHDDPHNEFYGQREFARHCSGSEQPFPATTMRNTPFPLGFHPWALGTSLSQLEIFAGELHQFLDAPRLAQLRQGTPRQGVGLNQVVEAAQGHAATLVLPGANTNGNWTPVQHWARARARIVTETQFPKFLAGDVADLLPTVLPVGIPAGSARWICPRQRSGRSRTSASSTGRWEACAETGLGKRAGKQQLVLLLSHISTH